ncbi:FAD-binding oxidoreductase [Steroidobacter sp. S1-65]|uniref:FAD-binding oxidoreductase n=1 Tax=Steroidobacter gossypii TaxID=2805490 RepID=A0ABS1WYE2_9GAMM|nr:FAD-dependent oxidoreductase [Steroidobacter gossypii]MBM0105991.1 FAD-binding oxidoreductase [Steroidobacter gossypii]
MRIIVIGGGIIGSSTALRLRAGDLQVTLVDPSDLLRAASWGNAGHIAIEQVEPLASWATIRSAPRRLFSAGGALGLPLSQIGRWLPFALRMTKFSSAAHVQRGRAALRSLLAAAMPAWRTLAASLGAPGVLLEQGHIVVWESPATAAAGLASWRSVDVGTARFHECDQAELREVAQLIKRPLSGGIRFENTGQIADLPKLNALLSASLREHGVELVQGAARAIEHGGSGTAVLLEDGKRLSADLVLITAGVRSRALLEPFADCVPLIAERGYHLQMPNHRWPDLPPLVFEDRSMIVTRFESGLRAASFVEFGNVDAPPDRRKWDRLRNHIAELGLPCEPQPESGTVEWMGARPTLPDYLPAIGRVADAPNILYAFGHQHLGLTLAAITAELVGQLIWNQLPTVDLRPFDIGRFSAA